MTCFSIIQEKKKTHKSMLTVSSSHVGLVQPYSVEIMAESQAKLQELARVDKDRMMLEEIRNTYESYIYLIKNKLIDHEDEINAISTEKQREALLSSAAEAEDWMYDEGYDAGLETYTKKYEELSAPAEKVFSRMKEVSARADAIKELTGTLDKLEELMIKWETTQPQVTEEERAEVISKVEIIRTWIAEKTEAQAAADPASDPVFTSAEVPLQKSDLQKIISKLSRKPKPAPKKVEKKNETNEEDVATDEPIEEKVETEDNADAKTDESEKKESSEETLEAGEEEKEGAEL
jgi:hypothetical protein